MLDGNKMQKLTVLVNASSILNAQEKAEWLSLMGLMNDKQLSELEEILKTSAPSQISQPAQPRVEMPQLPTPGLSHISNLPSQMVDPRLKPKSVLPNGPDKDFAAGSKLTPMTSVKKPVSPKAPVSVTSDSLEPSLVKPLIRPTPQVSRPTISSPILSDQTAAAGLKLLALSDVSKLTAEALHHQNRANFFAAISALAEKEGYFQVLAHIEESPLYQDYLNYGKLVLTGANAENLPLSQEEFEFVADLLQALKINRV